MITHGERAEMNIIFINYVSYLYKCMSVTSFIGFDRKVNAANRKNIPPMTCITPFVKNAMS